MSICPIKHCMAAIMGCHLAINREKVYHMLPFKLRALRIHAGLPICKAHAPPLKWFKSTISTTRTRDGSPAEKPLNTTSGTDKVQTHSQAIYESSIRTDKEMVRVTNPRLVRYRIHFAPAVLVYKLWNDSESKGSDSKEEKESISVSNR